MTNLTIVVAHNILCHLPLQLLSEIHNRKEHLQLLIGRAEGQLDAQLSFKRVLAVQLLGTVCDKENSKDTGICAIAVSLL